MDGKQCTARLKKYARTTGSALEFQRVEHNGDRFIYRAVINGQYFDNGVGENQKKAEENAAKIALSSLSEKENQRPVGIIPKLNYRRLLNEYAQKNRMFIKAVETPRLKSRNSSPCCSYVVGGTKYPLASGKTKKEAKEEAAKLAYHGINGSRTAEVPCSALCEAFEQLLTPRTILDFSDGESNKTNKMTATKVTARSDCVETNPPKTQDTVVSDTGNNLGVTFRNKSEFDSIEPLGKGGFGHVVKAREKVLNKFFAIKIVPCKDSKKALREVQALCELEHSNVIRYFSSWLDDTGCPWDSAGDSWSTSQSESSLATTFLYIQMDLCDTKTLKAWIDECNTLGVRNSLPNKRSIKGLDFVLQIVCGVEYIHSKMFIHRDLKPSNILFKGGRNLKIADFGLVTTEKDHNDENMERTVNRGTPTYMAPEQTCENIYDRKVDIFALGMICFEILWKISTSHERVEVLSNMRRQEFPEEFSQNFYSEYMIIRPMLNVKPEDRPEASAVRTTLEKSKHTLDTEETVRRSNRTI